MKTRRYGGAGLAGGAAEGDQQGLELSPSKLGLIYSHLSPDPVGGLRDSAASVSESEKKENRMNKTQPGHVAWPAMLRAGCRMRLGCRMHAM